MRWRQTYEYGWYDLVLDKLHLQQVPDYGRSVNVDFVLRTILALHSAEYYRS